MSDLYQLGRRLAELGYQGMGADELGLTPGEFLVLRDLFMNGPSAIRDTMNRTGLAQSRVSTSVAKLHDLGWVDVGADPNDGRKTIARVTEDVKRQGNRRRARPAADVLAVALPEVEPAEREALSRALERLHELLVLAHTDTPVQTLASEQA